MSFELKIGLARGDTNQGGGIICLENSARTRTLNSLSQRSLRECRNERSRDSA